MTKIEEIEQKLNEWLKTVSKEEMIKILEEEGFEVIDKESKKEKWLPKCNEEYWYRTTDGEYISCKRKVGVGHDDWRAHYIPIFESEEKCRKYWHFMDTVKEKSYEFSKEEWENQNIRKYIIYYDFEWKSFMVYRRIIAKYFGEIYFKTEEDAKYIIDNFKDELMEFFI